MAILIAQKRKALAPEGQHSATVVSTLDLGMEEGQRGAKDYVAVDFEIDSKNPESGENFRLRRKFTKSTHEKSKLRPAIEGILDRRLTPAEEREFDLESLIGRECVLEVEHVHIDGHTFARVEKVRPSVRNSTAKNSNREYEEN